MNPTILFSALALLCAAFLTTPQNAHAFCGSFVSGSDAQMYNSATNVVLMRKGTTTVLSMQNNYKGPTEDFAMIVPVPVVLMQDQVHTISEDIFKKLDTFTAPRLVAYSEIDPCHDRYIYDDTYTGGCPWDSPYYDRWDMQDMGGFSQDMGSFDPDMGGNTPPVKVEAQFEVGEYEVVILSAQEASGLSTWLDSNGYKRPSGADALFSQYIQQGMYFFVAKVNASKVTFDMQGKAVLSPLRFHYDSTDFALPIRLGLLNSSGYQDLIIHVLADSRYEVANYPNAFIPSNQLVKPEVEQDFQSYYQKLFSRTLAQNPGAVVTEYAWSMIPNSFKCDPCPPGQSPFDSPLSAQDLSTLGADVLDSPGSNGDFWSPNDSFFWGGYVMTRLHARYQKTQADKDLVFKVAPDVRGGRGGSGRNQAPTELESSNTHWREGSQFQGRYIIHNTWDKPIQCEDAVRGRWGARGSYNSAPSPNTLGQDATFVQDASIEQLQLHPTNIPLTGRRKRVSRTRDLGTCFQDPPFWWDGYVSETFRRANPDSPYSKVNVVPDQGRHDQGRHDEYDHGHHDGHDYGHHDGHDHGWYDHGWHDHGTSVMETEQGRRPQMHQASSPTCASNSLSVPVRGSVALLSLIVLGVFLRRRGSELTQS